MRSAKIGSKEQVSEFLAKYDTFLFDCDGVLWLGSHLLPSVVETLEMLRSLGKKLIFVTNNSTNSRAQYVAKFAKFGITVEANEVFGSLYASLIYVDKIAKVPKDKKIYVFGEAGIEQELHEVGYQTIGGTDPQLDDKYDLNHPALQQLDSDVGAVVVGLTTRINYLKMAVTLQYLLRPEVAFIATNIDSTYPNKGMILPGAGSVIQSVATASGRTPIACGKPNQNMLDLIFAEHKLDRSRTCMVGDRLNTDMKFGNDGGLGTLLVLTGIETVSNIEKYDTDQQPLFYAEKLGDLYEYLQK